MLFPCPYWDYTWRMRPPELPWSLDWALPSVDPMSAATVDDLTTHGLSCRWSEGRHPATQQSMPSCTGHYPRLKFQHDWNLLGSTYMSNRKRPDGCSILSWKCVKVLVWHATCPVTFTSSHLSTVAREARVVAAQAERLKNANSHLVSSHKIMPFMTETSGVPGEAVRDLIQDLG